MDKMQENRSWIEKKWQKLAEEGKLRCENGVVKFDTTAEDWEDCKVDIDENAKGID